MTDGVYVREDGLTYEEGYAPKIMSSTSIEIVKYIDLEILKNLH